MTHQTIRATRLLSIGIITLLLHNPSLANPDKQTTTKNNWTKTLIQPAIHYLLISIEEQERQKLEALYKQREEALELREIEHRAIREIEHRAARANAIQHKNQQYPKVASWESKLRASIEHQKRYPKEAQRNRQEGTVTVAFTVNTDGTISNIQIQQSSGHKILDEASMNAIKNVGRTDPHPSGKEIRTSVPIRFEIRYCQSTLK